MTTGLTPVAILPDGESRVGLDVSGKWYICKRDVVSKEGERGFVPFLPCLEINQETFDELLRDGLAKAGKPAQLVDTFPRESLVLCGLESEHERWVTLALQWILTIKKTAPLRQAVGLVLQRRIGSQRARQEALRWLRHE